MIDQQPLTIFVDALDECDADEVEEMVEYFEGSGQCAVSSGTRLNICFSSRHYPHIDVQYGRKLSLDLQEGHEKDIAAYIQSKLKIGKSKTAEEIKAKMRDKAGGIFMWVVLVAEILYAEYKGGRIFDVRKRLDAIPTKLSDLFREILWRDQKNLHDLQLCIQWIIFAKRPLKPEEYYFAAVSGLSPDELREWDPEDVTRDDMSRFVLSSSKGLAETTKSKCPTVQFIHESVREFFLKDGLRELWPDLTADFESFSHGQLRRGCHAYLKLDISAYVSFKTPLPMARSDPAKHLRSSVSDKFPFLEYATRHILYHANAAANAFPQDEFLENFDLEAWIELDNLFQIYNNRRHTPTASLLYILGENNLANLIRAALRLDSRINIQGERHGYPLFAALANGHRDAVIAMLQKEASSPQNDISAQLEYGGNFTARKGQTPLSWAAEHGHKAVVELLLDMDKVDVGAEKEDRTGRTPLSWAAGNGHETVVKLLLDAGKADVNASDKNRRTPLSWAADRGHETVVKLLLARDGVDINAKDYDLRTPLSWAAASGREAMVRLLLARDEVDVNSKDFLDRTPLSWAAEKGHETVVKVLLDTGKTDVNAKDKNYGWTLLLRAAKEGHEAVVKLLLDTGKADIDAKDNDGRTPLRWAAVSYRYFDNFQAKISLGPELNVRNRHSLDDNQMQFRLLEQQNKRKLKIAKREEYEAIVKLLLDTGKVDINARDECGQTPLSWAAGNGHEAVARLLLARDGVDVDAKDNDGRTPLLLAASNGHEAVAKLLLDTGKADIDAKDNDNQTPLLWAAKHGHEAVVRLLQSAKF
jgi:ankyrin repeat protein